MADPTTLPDLPAEAGAELFRWIVPADIIEADPIRDTPAVYAVSDRDGRLGAGQCLIWGYYPTRGRWIENPLARALVVHLLAAREEGCREREAEIVAAMRLEEVMSLPALSWTTKTDGQHPMGGLRIGRVVLVVPLTLYPQASLIVGRLMLTMGWPPEWWSRTTDNGFRRYAFGLWSVTWRLCR